MASFRLCILAVAVCLFMTMTYGAQLKKNARPKQNPPAGEIVKPGQNIPGWIEIRPIPNLPGPIGYPMNRPMKVKFNLAKSYGKLNATSLKNLDEALKVMIGGVLRIDFSKQYTWPTLIKTLQNCPYMVRNKKKSVSRVKRLQFRDTKVFGIHGDKTKRKFAIQTWFTNLIGNADILKDTKIGLHRVIHMVANTNLNMIKHLFRRNIHGMGMMDAGILRFPDVSQPYFSVYRISLVAKTVYHTYLFHQIERSSIIGTFHKEIFLPNEKYIYGLTDNLMAQLVKEANNFFDDF